MAKIAGVATDNERELAGRGRSSRDGTVPVSIGTIAGIGAWTIGSPLKDLKYRVIAPLHEITAESIKALKPEAVQQKAKWVSELDATLRRADEYVRQANQFARLRNWLAFEKFCLDSKLKLSDRGARVLRRLAAEV